MTTLQDDRTTSAIDVELSRLAPPTRSLHVATDREVLLAGRRARVRESQASAERWLCFVEFYRRRLATEERKRAASPHFALTARQETVVEIGALWGMDASRVRKELNVALFLCQHAPGIWERCQAGQLDGYRATLIADAAREKLDGDEAIARFSTQMLKFLDKHVNGVDGDPDAEPIVTCTVKQLRNAITYALSKVQPVRAEEEFRKAYAARGAFARDDVPGMAWLSVNGRVDQVRLAHHRLTLAARRKRQQGDERTLDQLRADLALDLLAGSWLSPPSATSQPAPSGATSWPSTPPASDPAATRHRPRPTSTTGSRGHSARPTPRTSGPVVAPTTAPSTPPASRSRLPTTAASCCAPRPASGTRSRPPLTRPPTTSAGPRST